MLPWAFSGSGTFFALENIYRVNCHNENMTKPFDYLVHKQWCQDFSSWWHWHFHWHEYLLLRNELSILSKWHAFAGYQLGFAVCTNCFEKCINCWANVNSDVRNAPKRLRKTVTWENLPNLKCVCVYIYIYIYVLICKSLCIKASAKWLN